MVYLNTGKSGLALAWAGSLSDIPRYCAIGSGSGTVIVTQSGVIAEIGSRQDYTTRDATTVNQMSWIHDFSSVQMSGVILTEFGLASNSATGSGTMFNREAFPSITFDGTNELQVSTTFEVF